MLKGCRLWLTVAVLAAAIAVVLATTRGRGELAVYTKAASRLLAGEEIYRTSDYKQFNYPPFFALPAVLLLALPESLQAPAWYFVSLLAMAAGVPIVLWRIWPTLRVTGEGVGPSRMVFLWLLSLLSWVHLTASIAYGSHDLLLFSCWRLGRAPGPQRRRGGPGSFSASGRRPKRLLCSSSPFPGPARVPRCWSPRSRRDVRHAHCGRPVPRGGTEASGSRCGTGRFTPLGSRLTRSPPTA